MAATFNPYPRRANQYVGISTDTKPMDAPNASIFYEMDTRKMFLFDADNKQWHFQFEFPAEE